MREPKVIKEETVLKRLDAIAQGADSDEAMSASDRIYIKTLTALLKDMVKSLPSAEDEDPNCQICYWHDLRKDPDDLPDDDILVRAHVENKGESLDLDCFVLDGRWYLDHEFGLQVDGVMAWTDIPIFDKEASNDS